MNKLVQQSGLGLALGLVTTLAIPSLANAQNAVPQNTSAATPAAASTKAKPAVKALNTPANAGTASGTHDTVEYKDPEDMTTRYRPGNNKTSAIPPSGNANGSPTAPTGEPATATDAKKHVSNIKWSDRQATVPALDAGSKDTAKSKTVVPTSPNNGKPADSTAQNSKHVDKVDSFTVKQ
jgi:hypothetical protein